jgi:hypothetical protein
MLDYDSNIRPFKLMGVTITMEMLVSIAVAAGSAIAAGIYATVN